MPLCERRNVHLNIDSPSFFPWKDESTLLKYALAMKLQRLKERVCLIPTGMSLN